MNPSRIIGAGLSGLIAAHAWQVPVVEAAQEPRPHKALLRFRSDNVSRLTGIDFKRVLVRKGIWSRGAFVAPDIALANAYSVKILGNILGDRSIWNLDPVERFIAPEDFQERLREHVWHRLTYGVRDDFMGSAPFISTAPLPVALAALGIDTDHEFHRSPIVVQRYRVPHCDAHQTVYFPDAEIPLYRASITGDVLIVEAMEEAAVKEIICSAFGIRLDDCEPLGAVNQEYGKIINLKHGERKALLFRLTHDHGLYSLGRFACWRNMLLDDVADDIGVIKKLMNSGNTYDLRKAAS